MARIVVPTDFSPIARHAAQFALALAKHLPVELVFFHASVHEGTEDFKKFEAEINKVKTSNSKLKVDFIFTDKLFNSLTIKEIFKGSIDYIIIGTSGEHADFPKKLFGTYSSELIENIKCPVFVIPPGQFSGKIKKIAYASDLVKLDREIRVLVKFAKPFKASIDVFHVSPIFPDLGDVEELDLKFEIDELKLKHHYPAISYFEEEMSRDNQIQKGIHAFLAHHHSDLLVLFHNNLSGIERFLSKSQTEKAVTHINTPILIFPKA